MSLLSQTARYLLGTALVIALVGSVGFYTLIQHLIRHEVDEILVSQVEHAQKRLQQQPFTTLTVWDDHLRIEPVRQRLRPTFRDVVLRDSLDDNKLIQVRQFQKTVEANGHYYFVRVSQPYYEFNELTREMSVGVIIGFLALMALSVGVGLGLARRLWRPFYAAIDQLGHFRLDQPTSLLFPPSRIQEFDLLSRSLGQLTTKLRQQFALQQQFTENASHELQTPLAVASAELDFLLQSEHLTEIDHTHLQRATDALSRLSQLNRSLLLLTQVENNQFATDETFNLSALTDQYAREYEPYFMHKRLTFTQSIESQVQVRMNRQLAGVLLTNLLKNAARHSPVAGTIALSLTEEWLCIRNSGQPLPFAESQLFDRFVKDPARPDSIGLGLALVKQICDRYGLPIRYGYDTLSKMHTFQIGLAHQSR